jgi:hypothetical protein
VPGAEPVFALTQVGEPVLNEAETQFKIFGAAELKQMVFKETMLRDAIAEKYKNSLEIPKSGVKELNMNLGDPVTSLAGGVVALRVSGQIIYAADIQTDEIKKELVGRNEKDLRAFISGLVGLERANIALWPFWVKNVPKDESKILISLD